MKKTIIVITIIMILLCITKKEVLDSNNMIRFRIIANSNEVQDQLLKKEILHNISNELTYKAKKKEEETNYIINSIPSITSKIDKLIPEGNYDINYGLNYFPEKTYNGITYPEGEYESLVITIGSGEGDNFWCILFPPLCMIDDEDIEYKSFIKEALNKIF